jgi:hypothetical protein
MAAGVPEQLYNLLSHPHTLLHALHLANEQLRLSEQELGLKPGPSPAADQIADLLATFKQVIVAPSALAALPLLQLSLQTLLYIQPSLRPRTGHALHCFTATSGMHP